ncbi:MAG: methyltransferase domain-containing protein [Phycisphaeraceae bacterium]|nr:methyltransferase domain-containing protein [Phycisphaeraceae bacterium]QYK49708.1 MAG: methyltransferase domain-containing protein [Phycisphaeraceae bacterium]
MSTAPNEPGRLKDLRQQVRLLLGLRDTITVDGVRYVERTHEPLRRALSKKGRGYKDYEVTFRSGERMRIRYAPSRIYADIAGASALAPYRPADTLIRPGARLLVIDAGTGFGAAWLVQRVGPAGAIVALEEDGESSHYAIRRYTLPNVAFERGSTESLRGELDGSFDGVVALAVLRREHDDRAAQILELWRVLKPGGWMLLGGPAAGEAITTILIDSGVQDAEIATSEVVTRGPDGLMTFLVRKGVPTAAEFRNESDADEGPTDA